MWWYLQVFAGRLLLRMSKMIDERRPVLAAHRKHIRRFRVAYVVDGTNMLSLGGKDKHASVLPCITLFIRNH